MYDLIREDMEIVSGGCGIRQAGERRSVVGKDPSAGANGLEKRCSSSSGLWSFPQGRIRRRGVGSSYIRYVKLCLYSRWHGTGRIEQSIRVATTSSGKIPLVMTAPMLISLLAAVLEVPVPTDLSSQSRRDASAYAGKADIQVPELR